MKQIKTKEELIDAKISLVDKNYIYFLTINLLFQKVCIKSNKIIYSKQLTKQKLTDETISFKISPCDKFICIYNYNGSYGYVYNVEENRIVLELNRGNYHTEQTTFPLQFLYKDNEILLIHCKNWNDIHITNLSTNKLLTERNKYEGEFYIDYFYGELHLSPKQHKLLSSGWVWTPVSMIKFIDIDKWLTTINEPEISTNTLQIFSYYWDRAVCWINEKEIAYLYDPREENADEEDFIDKFKEFEITIETLKQSYLAFYNIDTKEHTKLIPFEYPKNEYFEGNSKLFYNSDNNTLIYSSKELGIKVLTLNGVICYENAKLYIDDFCCEMNVAIKREKNQVEIISFDDVKTCHKNV